ncbi:SCO2523 family variant P-loop protein [Nocardia sp. CDC159]|uniref:SCO2523 family variant P-loop protein n=1 Tax=Nocardia pulmonis TaxID=2951408 RepID=A0A9X2E4Y0_9NOCA|nr:MULTISPECIES: SCO2523 family variant P-loop protein [Nocardia]MCM6774227.1 SCO2523 family variant P-loop protein [Nocardia pulmonis]MCM6787114.1 SCO2523 family variant P-loop protein [Nocardia sp. CDC159]
MLVFATSDKGGTGRSVTSCNIAYRLCLGGRNVAYVDFDFGSPTAGALFEISAVERGVPKDRKPGGVHRYLLGRSGTAARVDVGSATDRIELRRIGSRAGRLVLLPGDEGGAEFLSLDNAVVQRCTELLVALEQEFKVVVVDLSAGRSAALEIALRATAMPQLRRRTVRWLIFHRWTRQHILAAAGLVRGPHGLLDTGSACGHNREELLGSIRYVRTARAAADSYRTAERPAQAAWLQEQNAALTRLASANHLGATAVLGETPIEPVLQWREQVVLDTDVNAKIANEETAAAYAELARRLVDNATWERL